MSIKKVGVPTCKCGGCGAVYTVAFNTVTKTKMIAVQMSDAGKQVIMQKLGLVNPFGKSEKVPAGDERKYKVISPRPAVAAKVAPKVVKRAEAPKRIVKRPAVVGKKVIKAKPMVMGRKVIKKK